METNFNVKLHGSQNKEISELYVLFSSTNNTEQIHQTSYYLADKRGQRTSTYLGSVTFTFTYSATVFSNCISPTYNEPIYETQPHIRTLGSR